MPYPALESYLVKIMKKQKNTTLAFDILREEKKRTALWFIAFIVAFAVVIVDRIVRGVKHE